MPAHTDAATFAETTYAISASLPSTYDASGYGSTTITYTAIGKVESFPEIGSERPNIEFTPINGPIEYMKGTQRFTGGDMVMADVPANAGQVILKAAEASKNHYSMKITYPDGEIHYLDVLVNSWKLSPQDGGQVMKRVAGIQICKAPVVVAAV